MNDSNDKSTETASATDPLATLHKMSRTAGLGSTEYVEVNVAAVVALALGLASTLAVLGDILLVLPAAAIITGVVALLKINNSGGTQTGRGIAVLGIVLAVACVGWVGGREVMHRNEIRREQDQIVALIDRLGQTIKAGDYPAAYALFSPRFQEQIPLATFTYTWTSNQSSAVYGKVKDMRWNGILDVYLDRDTGIETAAGILMIDLDSTLIDRRQATFRKVPQQGWKFENLLGYFAAPAPTNRSAAQ